MLGWAASGERERGLSLKAQEFPEESQARAGLGLWADAAVRGAGAAAVMQGWLIGSWGSPGPWAGA